MASRYIPELIYSLAFSSLSVHLLLARRDAATSRRQLSARISLLDELATRLRAGEDMSRAEVARMRRLAWEGEAESSIGGEGEEIGWREVVFGRRERAGEKEGKDEWERKDLERARREFGADGDGQSKS
ncbi:hypothetical protein FA95DRAFT_1574889 [Auriscalpium vulgare]|uniref:Uncharacterized protein n=1 Tax=Auriscalpium vulgare TaxID=40419 RepID=A0ACB8RIL7_9AGAM|nr:hypothetical protein FA95DRAFT_1574889 [Auriscalpium vulgare]